MGAGKHTIVLDFKSDGPGLGKNGLGVLYMDGQEVARNSMGHTIPLTSPEDETFDIGQGTPNGDAPSIFHSSYTFKAEIEVPQAADGMLITQGGRFGG